MEWYDHLGVTKAATLDDVRAEVVNFTRRLGFETVSALAMSKHRRMAGRTASVHNTPQAWTEQHFDAAIGKRDPVLSHLNSSRAPIIWNRDTYSRNGEMELYEAQRTFGYATGIAVGIEVGARDMFLFGVDRADDLPESAQELSRLVADVNLFALHVQQALWQFYEPEASTALTPRLTMRELDVLKWTMEGKTAWETATLLGIAEQTTTHHISNAMKKLDCVNKQQAVVRALRLGLIAL